MTRDEPTQGRIILGQRLKAARLASKWKKLTAVAEAIGVHHSAMTLYEKGQRGIPADKLFKLCDLYKVGVDELRY